MNKERLVLRFRQIDYQQTINHCSLAIGLTVSELILQSVREVEGFHDYYSNPSSIAAYSETHSLEIEIEPSDYILMKNKADANGLTIEVMIVQAVSQYCMMYKPSASDYRCGA